MCFRTDTDTTLNASRRDASPGIGQRRLRILTIATHPVQYAVPLFRRFATHPDLDFEVAYCTLQGAEPAADPDFQTTIQWDIPLLDGYRWKHIPSRGSGVGFLGLNNPGLWKFIAEGQFDAINCHVGYRNATFWIALISAKLHRSAFLFGTDASSLSARDGAPWKAWMKRLTWPFLFGLADQVTAPSKATADLMHSLGIAAERVSVTPFVVDNDWWLEQARRCDRQATRTKWGIGDDQLAVLFCAKLQDWKRPLDLLRAFARTGVSNAVLVFAGDGPLRSQLEAEAHKLGIAGRVRMLGFVNQSGLPTVYSAADLFVLPSDYDPCPVVVCEAMICGLPVILSDEVRGRFDLVRPGLTGEHFPCGDVEALAAILRRLLENREYLARLAKNARERMATFSPRENVDATVAAVKEVITRIRSGSQHRTAGREIRG